MQIQTQCKRALSISDKIQGTLRSERMYDKVYKRSLRYKSVL